MASGTTSFLRESLVPFLSNIVDLGASFLRWRKIWTSDFDANGVVTVSRTPTATTDAANKAYVDAALAPTIATIEEVDGAPSIASPDRLSFDQADGFVVSNPAGSNVRIDLAAVPNSVLNTIGAAKGGTGIDTSASTGVAIVDAGVWSVDAALDVAKGGTNLASGTSGGVLGYTAAGVLASSAALTARALVIGGGAGATPTTIAAMTNGQLPIGSTGADPVPASLTGTANQVVVTSGAGSITLSTPQNIHTAATPTFSTLTLSGAAPSPPAASTIYAESTIKAWASVNATPAISDSFNLTSVADAGAGLTTVTLDRDFVNATYAIAGTLNAFDGICRPDSVTTGSFRMVTEDMAGVFGDAAFTFIAIGDQ